MGLLDNILNAPQKTKQDYFTPRNSDKDYDKSATYLNCESCGREFKGQMWMIKSKKSITCPSCWRTERRNEEFN